MIAKPLRERLIYGALSVFLAWHTLATIIAPAPDNSVIMVAVRPIFQPYLSLFRLDNPWDFFAPSVSRGSLFRYVVEDASGGRQTFTPAQDLNWYHPQYFWQRARYYAIMDAPDTYADDAAALLCRKHAAMRPIA